jgi:putative exosortase-associated protein (TIGR04073 family)
MHLHTNSPARNHNLCARLAACVALVALALPALLLPAAARAEEDTAARKFGRGLAGMTLGVLEVPGNIVQESRTNGIASGLTVGLAVGLGKMVARELVGAYEFVTAPFEIPTGFEAMLQPEFSWSYFESEPGRAYGFSDEYLSEEAYRLDQIRDAVVERRAGALVVSFPHDLLFDFDSAELSDGAKARLQKVAKVLRNNPGAPIVVAGYTDSFADNDTLSGRRSNRRVEIELRASGVGAYR